MTKVRCVLHIRCTHAVNEICTLDSIEVSGICEQFDPVKEDVDKMRQRYINHLMRDYERV